MLSRKKTPSTVETELLVQCRRRCCLCFGLRGDLTEKLGQIAHLDGNPGNSHYDNLVYLCFEHHSVYDSRSRMGKGLKRGELLRHRSELNRALQLGLHMRESGTAFVPHLGSDGAALLKSIQHHSMAWYNEVVTTISKLRKAKSRDEFTDLVFEYANSRKHLPVLLAAHKVLLNDYQMKELASDIDRFLYSLTGGHAREGFLALP